MTTLLQITVSGKKDGIGIFVIQREVFE